MLQRKIRIGLACLLLGAALPFGACAQKSTQGPDYSKEENWAYFEEGGEKSADLFFVCPTVDMGENGNYNMSMDDETVKASFVGATNMERGIYDGALSVYAPYYRQAAFPVYSLPADEAEPYFKIAYADVRSAFLWYVKNTPNDRPFVLAGFSQGADMVLRLLKEFFKDPACQNRLIAAYCIGWRITDGDLAACPWLKMAQGAEDTGVIVSFNSESVETAASLIVPAGVRTHGVNPLNWRTDGRPAAASENRGACFTDYSGAIKSEVPALTGAYLDETRGTLKTPEIEAQAYANSLFPDGVYHLYDYQFFYRNLQENVRLRVEAYEAAAALPDAA